ncbi:MAG: Mu transposase C-terminal domain-containing protein [Treponema sp.]|nr:Mu transposase C-terminal domain-containing protein [Treponema sp.]
MTKTFAPVITDKKHPLRCAVYDRFRRRNPLKKKAQVYAEIAEEFNISVPTVQRYIRKVENGGIFALPATRQGRHNFAWSDEAVSFFTNFFLVAMSEVGGCTVRNAYQNTAQEAQRNGWKIGSEASAYYHAKNISPAMIMLAKGGQRALDNMFYISRDLSKLKPFQLIVGDQHRFDFWCENPHPTCERDRYIRAECYLWLDMATRLVYGISFDPNYNSRTVIRALRVGIRRFGKFESTYNDNGTSEKSDLADQVVAALQNYGVRFIDEADLYHADNGRYVVEDTEGCVVDVVKTKADWEKRHRRIFAKVKNAKTKPIERFFSTLEQILLDMCLPGYVREAGMTAPEDEQATKRLAWQKKNGYILTYDEFITQVLKAIETYENRQHTTLGCSPKARLEEYKRDGWLPTFIDPRDEAYLFMESTTATVRGDRVVLNGTEYIGPDLTQEMILQNRGTLTAYNRKKIELRYDPENLDAGVFAIEPKTHNAIALRPVKKIDMLDGDQIAEQMAWKKRNMKAVQDAFNEATKNKNVRVLSDPQAFREERTAERLADNALAIESRARETVPPVSIKTDAPEREMPLSVHLNARSEISDDDFMAALASRISSEPILRSHRENIFVTERDRYQDVLSRCMSGGHISREDIEFRNRYESKMTAQEKTYWQAYVKTNA